jgi:hypothetical protein
MVAVDVVGSDSTTVSDGITSVLRLDLFENQKLRSSESQNSENDWSCGVVCGVGYESAIKTEIQK